MTATEWERTAERDPDHAARVRVMQHGVPARFSTDQPTPEEIAEYHAEVQRLREEREALQ